MVCPENQIDYIDVIKSAPATLVKDEKMVLELNYYVSSKFNVGVYNSCKDVQFPSGNAKVMTVMCGQWGKNCDPKKFFDYVGTKDPAPIQVDFKINDSPSVNGSKSFTPMNAETVSCAKAPIGYSTDSCICADCRVKCTP